MLAVVTDVPGMARVFRWQPGRLNRREEVWPSRLDSSVKRILLDGSRTPRVFGALGHGPYSQVSVTQHVGHRRLSSDEFVQSTLFGIIE